MTQPETTVERGIVEPGYTHFDELDSMGFVHNSRYMVLVERALTTFWARQGFAFTDGKYTQPDVFLAVAEFSISYRVPIRGTGEIGIHLWMDKLSDSSAVYGFRVLSADGGVVHAEGRRVHIRLDPKTLRPTAWSDAFNDVAKTLL